MGEATIYANTHLSGKSILMCLIPILVGVIMMEIICYKNPLRVLAPINQMKEVLIHVRFSIVQRNQECA